MRTLVVGDIHGAYKCLIEVLELAGPADRIIFLGDYTDGLPQSKEVIDHIMKMPNAICLRGNHDQWTIDWLKWNPNGQPESNHFTQGGRSTYESYRGSDSTVKKEHLQFLEGTLPHFLDEENRAFVHGGFDMRGLEAEMLIKIWDRDLIESAQRLQHFPEIPLPFSKYSEIYVGHTPTRNMTGKDEPVKWLNLWAMDTGCGWGGPLVAMDIDTKEIFYSKRSKAHYPEFKGR